MESIGHEQLPKLPALNFPVEINGSPVQIGSCTNFVASAATTHRIRRTIARSPPHQP